MHLRRSLRTAHLLISPDTHRVNPIQIFRHTHLFQQLYHLLTPRRQAPHLLLSFHRTRRPNHTPTFIPRWPILHPIYSRPLSGHWPSHTLNSPNSHTSISPS